MDNQKQVLEIKKYPQAILRRKCAPVLEITPKEIKLFEDMLLTMYTFGGVGLAASQIGQSCQIIVVDIGQGPIRLANPKILKTKGEDRLVEGCLSIPDINVEIKRPYEILLEGLNEKGELVEVKASGLLARVFLHEIDHLKGKLIIDYLNLFEKMMLLKSRKKIAFGDKTLPLKGIGRSILLDNLKVRFSVVRKVFYTFLHHKKEMAGKL